MHDREKVRYVFTSSNTCRGFHSFIPRLITGIPRLYVLQGSAGSGQEAFIRQLGEALLERGFRVEFWISAQDPFNPEGILIEEKETAVISGSLPAISLDKNITKLQVIDPELWQQQEFLAAQSEAIDRLHEQIADHEERAVHFLQAAKKITDIAIMPPDPQAHQEKINQLTDKLTKIIMEPEELEKHYFASAITAQGMINYIDSVTRSCRKRYIFTGSTYSDISTILASLAQRTRDKDLVVEYYHSGFDADRIAAVVIPNFQVALVDAGSLALNIQPGDEIIDSEKLFDDRNLQPYQEKMMPVRRKKEALLAEAQQQLEKAQLCLEDLKRIYMAAANRSKINRLQEEIIAEISSH